MLTSDRKSERNKKTNRHAKIMLKQDQIASQLQYITQERMARL